MTDDFDDDDLPTPPGLIATGIREAPINDALCPAAARQMIAELYPSDSVTDDFQRELAVVLVATIMLGRESGGELVKVAMPATFYAAQARFLQHHDALPELDACCAVAMSVVRAVAPPMPTHHIVGRA